MTPRIVLRSVSNSRANIQSSIVSHVVKHYGVNEKIIEKVLRKYDYWQLCDLYKSLPYFTKNQIQRIAEGKDPYGDKDKESNTYKNGDVQSGLSGGAGNTFAGVSISHV